MVIRRFFKVSEPMGQNSSGNYYPTVTEVDDELEADLVSSQKGQENDSWIKKRRRNPENDVHYPVLDFDFPCYVVESVDPDHGHLYIDKELTWDDYKKLLDVLLEIGLIQEAWHKNAMQDKMTFVRTEDRIKHDRVHGKTSDCYPGCLDQNGEPQVPEPIPF